MNKNALTKIKKKQKSYHKYLSTKEGKDYLEYVKHRNQSKTACRNAVRDFEKSLAKEAKTNSKAFYAYAKSKLKTRESIPDLISDNERKTSNKEKAECLNKYFTSVFTCEDTSNVPDTNPKEITSPSNPITFSTETVEKLLSSLNVNKSAGPDGIHPRILAELSSEASLPLSIIFEKSMSEGVIPNQWKDANITPLFKKGKRNLPENYRPISLTSVSCKLMEKIIRTEMINHVQNNKLFPYIAARISTSKVMFNKFIDIPRQTYRSNRRKHCFRYSIS